MESRSCSNPQGDILSSNNLGLSFPYALRHGSIFVPASQKWPSEACLETFDRYWYFAIENAGCQFLCELCLSVVNTTRNRIPFQISRGMWNTYGEIYRRTCGLEPLLDHRDCCLTELLKKVHYLPVVLIPYTRKFRQVQVISRERH